MTRTEDRLTGALAARAAAIREDSLRPLVAGELGPGAARAGLDRQRRGWHARLTPLAAAAAMLLVISGMIIAVHDLRDATSAPFADVGTAHAPPPYYVDLDWNRILTVQATSTGRVTDRLSPPYPWDGNRDILDTALASAANGHTFVVVYNDQETGIGPYHNHTGIYTFTLTSAGHIADFKPVKGGVLPGLARLSVAVSPNGSEVAIAGAPQQGVEAAIDHGFPMPPSRIIVVNLRTGRRVVFQGGMDRRGRRFGITDVSWANDGQSLAYLVQWCTEFNSEFYLVCASGHSVTELRMISVTGNGGPLSGGRTLLRDSQAYPSILQALVSPDGRSIVAMTERGREISLVRFDLRTGAPIAMLYRRHALTEKDYGPGPWIALVSSDGTGQYLILDEDLGFVDGWVHDGRFHPMKIGPLPGELESVPAW